MKEAIDRFKSLYADRAKKMPSGCIEWSRGFSGSGYGRICVNRKAFLAHRISYTIAFGPIPKGYMVCHKCDNPKCINPKHLFAGTGKDNYDDMVSKGRMRRALGRGHGQSKLTEKQVLAIYKDKRSNRVIGADYGIHQGNVWQIKNGRTWAWLTKHK